VKKSSGYVLPVKVTRALKRLNFTIKTVEKLKLRPFGFLSSPVVKLNTTVHCTVV
jgi:hypothetical protein